ncbi:MAG: hypothetical protein ACRD2E_08805 [Terriglobales bacterium]
MTRGDAKRTPPGQLAALAVLIVIAAALLWRAEGLSHGLGHLMGSDHGDAAVQRLLHQPDPTLHEAYLHAVRSIRYQGELRNLFAPAPAAPLPVASNDPGSPGSAAAQAAANAGPPPPPPIPLRFYGYATRSGEAKRVFLQWNDKIFIATQGEVVARRYQVIRIDPKAVAIEDLQEQRTEVLPLLLPPNAG